jgi:hypothetical protein
MLVLAFLEIKSWQISDFGESVGEKNKAYPIMQTIPFITLLSTQLLVTCCAMPRRTYTGLKTCDHGMQPLCLRRLD